MLDEERHALIDEACGVVAVHDHEDAARLTRFGLHALQHRGQEACGIAARDEGGALLLERRMGLVADAFDADALTRLAGRTAIGHVRYATTGASHLRNAQPLHLHTRYGPVALAHNGNLTNAAALRAELTQRGAAFTTETDTEVIAHLIARSDAGSLEDALIEALGRVRGAYSLVGVAAHALFAVRDPYGVRPLVAGRLGASRIFASESACLHTLGARVERELSPGELVCVAPDGAERWSKPLAEVKPRPCIFELVYFARPDSTLFGQSVHAARRRMGEQLAREASVEADVVVAVPESGLPAALGFAAISGAPFVPGLVRSRYVGRTFIEPTHALRELSVRLKLSPVRELVEGRRVVVVDDSIVRGTTSQQIVKMLREAGARAVHMRVASPPTLSPCFYGIDTRSPRELIAAGRDVEAIRDLIGADSLAYLSLAGLRAAVGARPDAPDDHADFCEACFTRSYPI